jgi:hypothetical protein
MTNAGIHKSSTFVFDQLMNCMRKTLFHILLILQILLILSPVRGFPQKNAVENKTKEKQNIYLDASFGAAIPLGNYANDDPKDKATGYAKTGYFIQVNVDWMGKNNLGLAFQLTYQNNSLSDVAETVYTYDTTNPLGPGNWSNIYVMAGPVFLKQFKKLAIDAKVVGGFVISTSPVFKTINPETKQNEGATATISQKVALKITLGYSAGFPKRDSQTANVIGIDTSGHFIYSVPVDISIKKTVSTFNTGLGIIYKF